LEKKNIKFGCLNSDPRLICVYKRIRKNFRNHTKLMIVLSIVSIFSFLFIFYIEPMISDNIWFKTLLMSLNIITFIGVFYPVSIKKNLTENDVRNTIDKQKTEDKINKKLEERATIS
jgi:amino acid transporter